ncbi:MAG: hypothetical protein Q4F88_03545 [Eubacteriales bacterium]|nr:hypothetical protein [Eubacteriales bacterium]
MKKRLSSFFILFISVVLFSFSTHASSVYFSPKVDSNKILDNLVMGPSENLIDEINQIKTIFSPQKEGSKGPGEAIDEYNKSNNIDPSVEKTKTKSIAAPLGIQFVYSGHESKYSNSSEPTSGNRVVITVISMKENPNNPVPGKAFNERFVFYTEAENLNQLMNDEGLTSDWNYINTICGIDPIGEEDSYRSPTEGDGNSWWKGTYWKLFVNGKESKVYADAVVLKANTTVKWQETSETTRW